MAEIQLYGRLFIRGLIQTVTGLHIGGSQGTLNIGGVDNAVIKDPVSGRPYIPGSSLKGKMRSLLEKYKGLPQQRVGSASRIHYCSDVTSYNDCEVCPVFGVSAKEDFSKPTRLIVRDVPLTEKSALKLIELETDLLYTEVKYEVSIDRISSEANPRPLERVPAGIEFGEFEFVYNLYESADVERIEFLRQAMVLLEDDYLGGSGSRGSGKIAFQGISVELKSGKTNYTSKKKWPEAGTYNSLDSYSSELPEIRAWVSENISWLEESPPTDSNESERGEG